MDGLDRRKFKELVLYIAEKSKDDPRFGSTELNKVLFFSDFLAYGYFERPITGAVYQRLPNGPAPRVLVPLRNELVEEGDARIETRKYFNQEQQRVVAARLPDLSAFSPDEIALVDDVIDQLRHHDAVSISDFSHDNLMGWQIALDGEDIPYEMVFVSVRPPSPSDIARGQELAKQYGW